MTHWLILYQRQRASELARNWSIWRPRLWKTFLLTIWAERHGDILADM